MSELLSPRQPVEYIISAKRQRKPPARWSILAGICVTVTVAVWFAIGRSPLKKMRPIDLKAVGINAVLKTKWDDGARYVLTVRPIPGNEENFDSVLRSTPHEKISFNVILLDSDGFAVCKDSPTWTRLIAESQKFSALRGEGLFPSCSKERFDKAVGWHVTYRFPHLGESESNGSTQ